MTTALVLGGADCVWRDVEAALALGEYQAVVTCNDVTALWPGPIDAAVSLHAETWPVWLQQRARNGFPAPAQVVGHDAFKKSSTRRGGEGVTTWSPQMLPGETESGSSGLFAAKFALVDLGHDRAVLCGVPMTAEARHFFDKRSWGGAAGHRRGWRQAEAAIQGRLKSMSGWTKALLGAPSPEWIAGGS
jgi:hypothetical protein